MEFKNENKKEFVCRRCLLFLNAEDFVDGKCPECGNDEDIFQNDVESES